MVKLTLFLSDKEHQVSSLSELYAVNASGGSRITRIWKARVF